MAVLERARQPGTPAPARTPAGDVTALELDRTARGPVKAAEDIHERRLAGAVRPDQPEDLAAPQLERDVTEGVHALEGPRHGGGPERRSRPPRFLFSAQIFATTFATIVPTTFGTLFWIRMTR